MIYTLVKMRSDSYFLLLSLSWPSNKTWFVSAIIFDGTNSTNRILDVLEQNDSQIILKNVNCKDEQVEGLLSNLRERLRGEQGGKIFVVDVSVAIDITTNKGEEEAI